MSQKKVGFTATITSSKSHFFLGHLVQTNNQPEYFLMNKSKGPKAPSSQVPRSKVNKVSWSQDPKVPSSKALKPFYSSQNLLNLSLTLKQLIDTCSFYQTKLKQNRMELMSYSERSLDNTENVIKVYSSN